MTINRSAILYDNLVLAATLTATSEASSDFTVDKLKTLSVGDKWRSTSLADQTIIAEFDDDEFVPCVLIWGHNFSGDSEVRIRISPNSDLSDPTFDYTFSAYPGIDGYDDEYDLDGYDGAPVIEDLQPSQKNSAFFLNQIYQGTLAGGSTSGLILPNVFTNVIGADENVSTKTDFFVGGVVTITAGTGVGQTREISAYDGVTRFATISSSWITPPDQTSEFLLDLTGATTMTENDLSYNGLYVGITISDPTNPAGYVQFGVLGLGIAEQLDYDISTGNQFGHVDISPIIIADDGNPWPNPKAKHREESFTYDFVSEDEARGFIDKLAAYSGVSRPIWFFQFVENSFRSFTNSIYGLMVTSPRPRQVRKDYTHYSYAVEMGIREITSNV